ncbi:UPF0545 protein C22orf39 homolog [Malaya genurostris]|uniref:UPF0545 protein C22orf39 homolog n=1 Tax=Malaya genurostris TaxID=325434 RepID=UPI0026F38062|nr:UPF0545 protein C22orf39 homolog [Malaya genurostris]
MTPNIENLPQEPTNPDEVEVSRNLWSIRPCFSYSEEYDDCTSIKARFNQYFIHGESIDCTQWKRDFDNCVRFERNPKDTKSALELIQSERQRRIDRLGAHYRNDVWKKREKAPEDWSKPLPENMQKDYEQTYLAVKAQEMRGVQQSPKDDERTMCVVM